MPKDDNYRSYFKRSRRVNRRQSKAVEKYARSKMEKKTPEAHPLVTQMWKDITEDIRRKKKKKKKMSYGPKSKKKEMSYTKPNKKMASDDVFKAYLESKAKKK